MLHSRRWALLACVLALGAILSGTGFGQVKVEKVEVQIAPAMPIQFKAVGGLRAQPMTKGGAASNYSSIKIIEKSEYRQVINVARDCIKDQDWTQAVKALQTILDNKEDHYVQVRETDTTGQPTLRWTSVKFEANNLLGSMPVEGLEAYEVAYGARAKDLLDEAKQKGDRELLAEVAQRYCHSRAGIEANELLATLFLARGQHFMAALRFEKLLAMPAERAKLSEATLYKAALAFHRAGDDARAEETWKRLEPSLKEAGGLQLGERTVNTGQLYAVLRGDSRAEPVNLHDWLMVRGNVSNTAQANGSPPLLDKDLWRRPLLRAALVKDDTERDHEPESEKRVLAAIKQMHDQNHPVLAGFFPIATQGLMVYRSYRGLNAVYLKETRDSSGEVCKAGDLAWSSIPLEGGLPALLDAEPGRVNSHREKVEMWLQQFGSVSGFASLLYENSAIGTLSCDHKCVYAIDDLAVPPPMSVQNPYVVNMPAQISAELNKLVMRNNLMAYHLVSGKLDWDTKDEPAFADSHFLGVPISVGGKLYVLNEKNPPSGNQMGDAELRLVCIDPNKRTAQNKPTVVEPIQLLGMVNQHHRVTNDISRRLNAVHLAYGEGILVCPTNAGEVFGVDLMTRSLVWSYPYREKSPDTQQLGTNPAGMPPGVLMPGRPGIQVLMATTIANWKSAPPAIAEGMVVFTAPDAHSIHCINLRDGKPVWKKPNQDDLYLAGVYQGRVLVAGKNRMRAYSLKDGTEVWHLTTGDLPSGQGVASKNIYYLPLQKGEILAIDIEKGTVKAHNRAADGKVTPGNLVFHDGMVLSQTPTEVVAYPQLVARLEFAKKELQEDPGNLEKRADLGELLLKDGQVQPAVDELLQVASKNAPAPLVRRAKDRLFEALTDLLQVDFPGASRRYLDEYKVLAGATEDESEKQQRLAKYYRIVGQGREAQGELVEAFRMYKDFGALPLHREGGVASAEDPGHKIPTHVWLRGRISGMIDRATAEQREPLEQKIAEEWRAVEARKDIDAIRSFVGMFDVPFRVGREARLRLAEEIMERNDRSAFLEAELYLKQLLGGAYRQDPEAGGRALAALARLEEKKGTIDSMKLAAAYYRDLAREFPKARVRQDQTGTDLLENLQTDKRYLAFLEEVAPQWGHAPLKARELAPGSVPVPGNTGFVLSPEGDQTPFARRHRLLIDRNSPGNATVRLVDLASGRERWEKPSALGPVPENDQIFFYLYGQASPNTNYHPNAPFRFFQVKGHLLVFQVGIMVYCLDGDTGQKLWEQTTAESLRNQVGLVPQQVVTDEEGNPEFIMWNQKTQQRTRVTLGKIGPVEASYIALLTQKGLVVNDPLKGSLMWSRAIDPSTTKVLGIFGDEQTLFLVEGNDGAAAGVGRAFRANDGEMLKTLDFGTVFQHRIRVHGRRILAAVPGKDGLTLKLYDILAGKDHWSKLFPTGTTVLQTEDHNLTGVIDPKGQLIALDVETGQEVLNTSLLQGRNVTLDDLKRLHKPLLLHDREHFYVALNQPLEHTKVAGGLLHNNFNNGLRCVPVNGWFLALHRRDGQKQVAGQVVKYHKGELAWDSFEPIINQMLVMEQFEQLPVLIFSGRYTELFANGGNRWVSETKCFARDSGSMIYPVTPGHRPVNGMPQFVSFQVDARGGTITLHSAGNNTPSVEFYVDDGRPRAALQPWQEPATATTRPLPPGGNLNLLQQQVIQQRQMQLQLRFNAVPVPAVPPPPPPAAK